MVLLKIEVIMLRIRIIYKKFGNIIYTSNLDLQKIWERVFRRAELKISFTLGFHPQARIQQAAPLPLGLSSKTEIVDIWLDENNEVSDLMDKINLVLPEGLEVFSISYISLQEPALQNRMISSTYQIELHAGISKTSVEHKINQILKADELIISRRDKFINLRERIENIELLVNDSTGQISLLMRLSQRPESTGRPDDVLKVMEIDPFNSKIERISLIYS
jgi:radical SAM-linked protein